MGPLNTIQIYLCGFTWDQAQDVSYKNRLGLLGFLPRYSTCKQKLFALTRDQTSGVTDVKSLYLMAYTK